LALKITESNTKVESAPALIGSKMQWMEEQYRAASDWLQNPGEAVYNATKMTPHMLTGCVFLLSNQ